MLTRKYYLFLFMVFVNYSNTFSQKLEVFSDFKIGFLSHQSLKEFHNELTNDIPFDNIKTTDNFNSNYGFNFGIKFNKFNTSIFYSHRVSGAKSSYSDFSGYIRLTNELKGSTIGVMYEKELKRIGKGKLLTGFKALLTFSNLQINNENKIANTINNDKLNFNSTDFGGGVELSYNIPIAFFTLKTSIGFDVYINGKLNSKEIPNAHLINKNGDKVTTDWTGFNVGMGIIIPILK
ncbi:hypothetical protein [Tenacibaculum sp.]|uniref:hypothetical protein n=1 Tax=Tenacibaculum sp. TaxID=1906242 RepID=UPI003D133F33